LGDDVLAVMDALRIDRPVLVGHSMAGEELSSVGSRFPERVAGLIYLEAAYSYAFYDPSRGDLTIDSIELRNKIDQLVRRDGSDPRPVIADLLQSVPQFERDLQEMQRQMPGMPDPRKDAPPPVADPALSPAQLIFAGWQKYTSIKAPVLVIFAEPHAFAGLYKDDPAGRAKAEADDVVNGEAQAKVIASEAPSSHIVRMAHATHMIYQSREADVLREMNAFLDGLPSPRG
jgi:pimeloyl-ACP methyl ester carboxylesterase